MYSQYKYLLYKITTDQLILTNDTEYLKLESKFLKDVNIFGEMFISNDFNYKIVNGILDLEFKLMDYTSFLKNGEINTLSQENIWKVTTSKFTIIITPDKNG